MSISPSELAFRGRWHCTDVGRRTITAIELKPDLDPAWYCGPPYSVPEVVFD
jgi:hypothetical protein